MSNSKLLSSIAVALVATLVLCTVAATVTPSVRADNGWGGGAIPRTTTSYAQKYSPSLAYTSTGDPRVAYYDYADGDLRYMARADGVWYYKLVDSVGDVGDACALALKNDLPWISYLDSTNGDLKCAWKDANSVWHIERVDTAGYVGWATSICISPLDGQPRISYLDGTNTALKYAYRTGSGSWVTTTVESVGEVGRYTSIAINPVTKGIGIGYPVIDATNFYPATLEYLKFAWRNPGMATFQTKIADTSVVSDTSLAFDAAGNPCIAYSAGSDLKYTKLWEGTWFYKTFPTAADDGHYTSLVLSNGGYPRISSIDLTNSRVLFTWKDSSGVWHTESVYAALYVWDTSIAIYRPTGKTGISYMTFESASSTYFSAVNLRERTFPFN